MQASEKKRKLSEKYNIAMTSELEKEVVIMCKCASVIEEVGFEKGNKVGFEKGRMSQAKEAALRMHEQHFTAKQIADIQGVDIILVEKWIAEAK